MASCGACAGAQGGGSAREARGGIAHIVCAAPAAANDAFELCFQLNEDDMLIAADGGYAACLEAGLQPDLLVGDFDSLAGGKPAQIDCPVLELPCKKDDTDLMVCLRQGLQAGYREFRVHRALGGDLGHTAAAVRCLAWLREQGANGVLYGGGQSACIVLPQDGEFCLADVAPEHCLLVDGGELAAAQSATGQGAAAQGTTTQGAAASCEAAASRLRPGTRVSVFSFGGDAHGVLERGLEWELDGATLRASDHIGVSNESISERPVVAVTHGTLLVIVG